jgi:predicted phage terminase large subunit-like protein
MPPRHGKSEFTSKYFLAWFLGRWPRKRVILASYGASFATSWGRKVRDLLDDVGEEFFGISIRKDSKAADQWEIEGHGGGMQTCGVGGPLTGKGADLLIIDDPVKNAEEANSEVYRDKTWDWYTSTAYTRLEPGGAVILIQTRWHADDLAGRILAQAKETGEPWVVVNLPAIAGSDDQLGRSVGEPLWPDRFDAADLERIKRSLGTYMFSALYGQSPTPADGGLFQRSWFRYWTSDGEYYKLGPERRPVRIDHCRRFGTMDLAFSVKKEADYTVICAWAVTPQHDLVLLDIHREHMAGPSLVPAAKAMVERYNLDYLGIEKILGQALVVGEAREKGLTIRPLIPDVDKITRSIPAQVRMEAGQIFLPQSHSLLGEIEQELLTFPRGTHDDIVDNFGYAAAEVQRFGGPAEAPEIAKEREQAAALAERTTREEKDRISQGDPMHPVWWEGDMAEPLPNQIVVKAGNPAALDRTLNELGAVIEQDDDGQYIARNGGWLVRVVGDVEFVKFAIRNQGYGEIIE